MDTALTESTVTLYTRGVRFVNARRKQPPKAAKLCSARMGNALIVVLSSSKGIATPVTTLIVYAIKQRRTATPNSAALLTKTEA